MHTLIHPHTIPCRYYLKGPKAGTVDTFATNLPGLPDNITPSSGGGYWVAFAALRDNSLMDIMAGLPWLRTLMYKVQSLVSSTLDIWLCSSVKADGSYKGFGPEVWHDC